MSNLRKNLTLCGVLAMAAMAWQCDSNGTQGSNPDLSTGGPDLATPAPDLATLAAPTITTVAPNIGPNTGGTAITITGTGFQIGATVTVGGTACTQVTVVSATSITCTTAAKAAFCGPTAVAVTNPDSQSATAANAFGYASRTLGFAAAKNVANNNTTSRDAVGGDFNLDGKSDFVNANGAAANNLTVQLGNGDGTFTVKGVDLGAQNTPGALAVGDMDNDGTPDIVAVVRAAAAQPLIIVLHGNKDGTFTAKAPVNLSASSNPTAVAIASADNKAKPYVVVSGTNGAAATAKAAIDVLQNDGTGVLSNLVNNVYGANGTSANHVALADINKDGKLDVVTVNNAIAGSVHVLTGNGAGVFTSVGGSPFLMGVQPNHVVVADFDKDGNPDIATANTGNGVAAAIGISTRKGDGAGGFGNAPTAITLTQAPTNIAAADLNTDGYLDLVVSHAVNSIDYLTGKAGLTFNAATSVPVNTGANSLVIAPFNTNSDTLPDIVTSSGNTNNLSVLINQCQ